MSKKSEKRQVKHLLYVKNLDLLCMKMLFALSQSNGGMRNSLNALVNFNWTRGILTKLVYCTKLSFKTVSVEVNKTYPVSLLESYHWQVLEGVRKEILLLSFSEASIS